MKVSKDPISKILKNQILKIFYQLIADFDNPVDVEIFLRDFLLPNERLALAKRLTIAIFLEKGRSWDYIKKQLKVSSATIASVQKMMEENSEGFILALQKIKTEEWANKWSEKIINFLKKIT